MFVVNGITEFSTLVEDPKEKLLIILTQRCMPSSLTLSLNEKNIGVSNCQLLYWLVLIKMKVNCRQLT